MATYGLQYEKDNPMNKNFTSNDNNCNGFVYDNGKRNIGYTFAAQVKGFLFNVILLVVALGVGYLIVTHL